MEDWVDLDAGQGGSLGEPEEFAFRWGSSAPEVIDAVRAKPKRPFAIRPATVITANSNGTYDIQFPGQATIPSVKALAGAASPAGAVVWVAVNGLDLMILGVMQSQAWDTGWVTLGGASGFTPTADQRIRRVGDQVNLVISCSNTASISFTSAGDVSPNPTLTATLAAQFCPASTRYGAGVVNARGGFYSVTAAGVVQLGSVDGYGTASSFAAGSSIRASLTWFVG